MGKASRLKKERNAKVSNSAPSPVPSDEAEPSLRHLEQAVIAVGDVFGEEANCAAAAALLSETAKSLGFDLTVRPVSVLAHEESSDTWVVMGPAATARIPDAARGRFENRLPDGKDNGHVILTTDAPIPLLLDPNLRQLNAYGIAAPSVIVRLKSTDPSDGAWGIDLGDLKLTYILDEGNRALVHDFEETKRKARPNAEQLADFIRSGESADQIRLRMIRPPA